MIQLSANLSAGLVDLIQSGKVQIDAVEVGPWFRIDQIQDYRRKLQGYPFFLHFSNLISRLKWIPGANHSLQEYLLSTHSPWLSFHAALLPPGYVWLANKFGFHLPILISREAEIDFIRRVKGLEQLHLPLLLENMPSFSTPRYALETSAEFISRLVEQTMAGFLLDIAHARVAASVFGWDAREYMESLPLHKLKQIHISGPRMRNGILYDAHEDLGRDDYRMLEWVLERSTPAMVTLEYFRDATKLCKQMAAIKEIIAAHSSAASQVAT